MGKRTQVPARLASLPADALERMKQYAGETVSDGSGYQFEVLDSGFVEIVATPHGNDNRHVTLSPTKNAAGWQAVALIVLSHPPKTAAPKPEPKPAPPEPGWFEELRQDMSSLWDRAKSFISWNTPEPANDTLPTTEAPQQPDAAKPAAPATPAKPAVPATDGKTTVDKTPAPGVEATTNDKGNTVYQQKAVPLAVGDVARVSHWIAGAKLVSQQHRFEQSSTKEMLVSGTYVRVTAIDGDIVQVDQLEGPSATGGTSFGWVRQNKLVRLARAPRPSVAATQMNRVADIASAYHATQTGICFTFVKNYIAIAGGYGDILDIHTDPRFDGMGIGGKDFATQVDKVGAAELGLEKVGGTIADQQRGTIIVTRGNGKNGIHLTYGDIAVYDRTEGGVSYCFNDGIIQFSTAEKHWASGGKLEGSLVAMYRPIDRK